MKTGYVWPSGTFNIVLTDEDLKALLEKKTINKVLGRDYTSVARIYYNANEGFYQSKTRMTDYLGFYAEKDFEDINKDEYHNIQFLNISVDN